MARDPGQRLLSHAGFADARLTHDQERLWFGGGGGPGVSQLRQNILPPHECGCNFQRWAGSGVRRDLS